MATGKNLFDHRRMFLGYASQREKGGLGASIVEQIKQSTHIDLDPRLCPWPPSVRPERSQVFDLVPVFHVHAEGESAARHPFLSSQAVFPLCLGLHGGVC